MGGSCVIFDNYSDRVVIAEVVDVPFGVQGVRSVALVSEEEDRVVVISAEGDSVHRPEPVAGFVLAKGDSNRHGRFGRLGGGEGEKGDGFVEGVIATVGIVKGGGYRGRDRGGVGAVVIDYGQAKVLLGRTAITTDVRPHENFRPGGQFSLDDDIGTLSNSEGDHVGFVWLNRDEVVGHDGHCVVINSESLNGFGACINKSEAVFLSRRELELGETGVRCAWKWLAGRKLPREHCSTDKPGHWSQLCSQSSFFR